MSQSRHRHTDCTSGCEDGGDDGDDETFSLGGDATTRRRE